MSDFADEGGDELDPDGGDVAVGEDALAPAPGLTTTGAGFLRFLGTLGTTERASMNPLLSNTSTAAEQGWSTHAYYNLYFNIGMDSKIF